MIAFRLAACLAAAALAGPASAQIDGDLRARLIGAWVGTAGHCDSGEPWQFQRNGRFASEDMDGNWRVEGRTLVIDGRTTTTDIVGGRPRLRVVERWTARLTVDRATEDALAWTKADGERLEMKRCPCPRC